jgi:hypothetical protein
MKPEDVASFKDEDSQKRRAEWTRLEETGVHKQPECQRIFENVCDQLARPRGEITPEQHWERFVARLADGAKRHIEDVEVVGSTHQHLYRAIWQRMAAYIARYQGNHKFTKKRDHVLTLYHRLTGHVDALIAQGIVDDRTARVFLSTLTSLAYIGDYQAVIRNPADITPERLRAKNRTYVGVVRDMWGCFADDRKQGLGDFVHFNAHLGRHVKNRVYISARLAGAPGKVVKAWQASLQQTALQDEVYFKLPTRLSDRFETIIFFQSDNTHDADVERLLVAFATNCASDLLSARDMPTGIPIGRGISMAPEPAHINTFTRYSGGRERISYNQLIAAVSELAFALAYQDAQTRRVANAAPEHLKERAGIYFERLIRLAEINPDTMMPIAQGGTWPAWAVSVITRKTT